MKLPHINAQFAHMFFCLATLLALASAPGTAAVVGDKDWIPIDPAHMALKEPAVEKDADAEALFWQVRVADEVDGGTPRTVLTHYIRIKIFTERGRESQSRIDIPFGKIYDNNIRIKDIAGRTIKPDGTIVELKKEDIFERTIVKASGLKVKAKSFVMPSVEPGVIIEYRWREIRGDTISYYDRLEFAREIPVQLVKYYVKPLEHRNFEYGLRIQTFHGDMTPFQKEKDGFYSTMMTNVRAFREEPHMPPASTVRPWMLVYYAEDKKLTQDAYWKDLGRDLYNRTKSDIKVNDDVKKAAAQIVGDAQTPEQKLERLFDYCRANIKNIYDDANDLTPEQREKAKNNKSPADTLKRGVGTGWDIDMLFAALATASGFEARITRLSSREHDFFDPAYANSYFLNTFNVAVKVGSEWRFFDPLSVYVPFGMLRWQEEGQDALLTDAKESAFIKTPVSAPEKSLEKRTGKFKLDEDGTLEGDVRIEYTGHLGVDMKERYDEDSPAEREEALKEQLKKQLSTAELTDVRVENVTDPFKPFVYQYHVRVPGYAQRTGKRLFLQPAYFRRGVGPLFSTSGRRNAIYFHYPWMEEDSVTIELPEGFELDNAVAPGSFGTDKLSRYEAKIQVTKDGRTLFYKRMFFFGGGTSAPLLFSNMTYPQLKTYFDQLHTQDNHTLSLKQGAKATTASGQSSN